MPVFFPKKIKVSIPGKIMLAGEYSVLLGGKSLSFAIDKRLEVLLEPIKTPGICVHSNLWKTCYKDSFKKNECCYKKHILLESIYNFCSAKDFCGFNIRISSDLNVKAGVGSSSAIVLAIGGSFFIFEQFLKKTKIDFSQKIHFESLCHQAYSIQKKRQGKASGYDILTQYYGGGQIYSPDYNKWPGTLKEITKLKRISKIVHIFVNDMGAPTTQTMNSTYSFLEKNNKMKDLKKISEKLIDTLSCAIENEDFPLESLILQTSHHRSFFEKSSKFPKYIFNSLKNLSGFDQKWSFKTSGAGGEDAILIFGERKELHEVIQVLRKLGWNPYKFKVEKNGINYQIE